LSGGTAERGEQRTAEEEKNTQRARDSNLDVAGFKKGNNKAAKLKGGISEKWKQVLVGWRITL